jgi:hypothetical protein
MKVRIELIGDFGDMKQISIRHSNITTRFCNRRLYFLLIQADEHLSLDAIFLITDLQIHYGACFGQINIKN